MLDGCALEDHQAQIGRVIQGNYQQSGEDDISLSPVLYKSKEKCPD